MKEFYERNIVEIREEYTTFLINILTPFIYDGLKSIYQKAEEKRKVIIEETRDNPDFNVPSNLKIFQMYLKNIPSWNNHIIEDETSRIRSHSKCGEWLDNLIKAVVKSNIVLLTFNAQDRQCNLTKNNRNYNVSTQDMIHKAYIECARTFYNFPEIFLEGGLDALDIKRNRRETMKLIGEGVKESIRKLLPIKLILEEFLQNDYLLEDDDEVDNLISENQMMNVKEMVNRDLEGGNKYDPYEQMPVEKNEEEDIKNVESQLEEIKNDLDNDKDEKNDNDQDEVDEQPNNYSEEGGEEEKVNINVKKIEDDDNNDAGNSKIPKASADPDLQNYYKRKSEEKVSSNNSPEDEESPDEIVRPRTHRVHANSTENRSAFFNQYVQ